MKLRTWSVLGGLSITLAACSAGSGGASGLSSGSGASASSAAGGGSASSSGSGAASSSGGSGVVIDMDAGQAGNQGCGTTSQKADPLPLDLFILLDQSGSMTEEGDRWNPVTTALKTFVTSPGLDGVGVGLNYFPKQATIQEDPVICLPATYVTPEVPIAELPGNAALITSSIEAHFFTAAEADNPPHWGTPTKPAVEGVLQTLAGYSAMHPERKLVLLLATDGKPSSFCTGNNIPGIAQVLAAASAATPPIVTYVIGIGAIDNLNELAVAGGTGHDAFIVDATGANTEAEFAQALDAIRRLALPCEYPMPQAPTGEIDPGKVNVQHQADGATAGTVFPKVTGAADCRPGETNWYYDDDAAPTSVIMCPAACELLESGGQIDMVFGCATEVAVR